MMLASSQVSGAFRTPLPHRVHGPPPGQLKPASMTLQSPRQPSLLAVLPSSHSSLDSSAPLPHSSQATPAVTHVKWGSTVEQVASQPSPPSSSPSSQVSFGSMTPLPHSSQRAPGTWQM